MKTKSTTENLNLTPYAIWNNVHDCGPVVVFVGKPTAYVVAYDNPLKDKILEEVRKSIGHGNLRAVIDWQTGELLDASFLGEIETKKGS